MVRIGHGRCRPGSLPPATTMPTGSTSSWSTHPSCEPGWRRIRNVGSSGSTSSASSSSAPGRTPTSSISRRTSWRNDSCLMISPGQVHRFGPPSDWTGWMLIVSGHLVSDDTRELPAHVRLDRELAGAVSELFDRMEADARLPVDRQRLVQLLALQTAVLVGRLALGVERRDHEPTRRSDPAVPISRRTAQPSTTNTDAGTSWLPTHTVSAVRRSRSTEHVVRSQMSRPKTSSSPASCSKRNDASRSPTTRSQRSASSSASTRQRTS